MHTTYTKPGTQAVQFTKLGSKNQGLKNPSLIKTAVIGIALCLSLSSCGTMSNRGKSTAIGAGVGAVAGAVLTGGSALGTVGGAAVGGVVGNQIGK
jgi:osmotically inducible lipoprotein OsmB